MMMRNDEEQQWRGITYFMVSARRKISNTDDWQVQCHPLNAANAQALDLSSYNTL